MKKGVFSKVLVVTILIFMALMAVWAMRILSHTGVEATGILGIVFSFFGGELVMLLLKRLFANKREESNLKEEVTHDRLETETEQ